MAAARTTNTPLGKLRKRTWARATLRGSDHRLETAYTYNATGDLETVGYDDGITPGLQYAYDRRGRPATITRGGAATTLAYDDANEILSEKSFGGILGGLSVTRRHDPFLRRTNLSLSINHQLSSINYSFDSLSRLETVTDDRRQRPVRRPILTCRTPPW